eukprot:gene5941-6880_t
MYPNYMITSTTTATDNMDYVQLDLPFRSNVSIDKSIGELTYNTRGSPFEVSDGPYSRPHRCFFHPATKQIAVERSVLPLFNTIVLILATLLIVVLTVSRELRVLFNRTPIIMLVYFGLQVVSLDFLDTVDYTMSDLTQQLVTRIILVVVGDLLYEHFTNSAQERSTFHFIVFVLYMAFYYHLFTGFI